MRTSSDLDPFRGTSLTLEPDLMTPMAEAREVLGNFQQMLEILRGRHLESSSAYLRLVGMARELSVRLRETWEQADVVTRSQFSAHYSLDDIELEGPPLELIRSTLGPADRPGAISSGPEVRTLQVLLNHQGVYTPRTGVYDVMTASAVSEFQKRNGLPVTGLVGVEMRQILNSLIPPA